jgi:hypothetical protein
MRKNEKRKPSGREEEFDELIDSLEEGRISHNKQGFQDVHSALSPQSSALFLHASNRNGPDWATDYLSAPVCDWTAQEIDFVDWVFNSSAVLRERASLMEQHEGLTYEQDAARREPFALQSSYFVNELTDDLSKAMVKRIQNRYGVEIWPWERAGITRTR